MVAKLVVMKRPDGILAGSLAPNLIPKHVALAGRGNAAVHGLVVALLLWIAAPALAQRAGFPPTPQRPVTDDFHGVKVIDNYRWLEDASDKEVQHWISEQNRFSRSILDAIPARAVVSQRLKDLYSERPVVYYNFAQRVAFFAMKSDPGRNQPVLVMMKSPEDQASERVTLDPRNLNPNGTTAIGFFVPSLDGRLVAVSLSENGSEDSAAYVYETATGKKLPDVVPRVQYATAGGSLEWNQDSSGFYYTRYPQGTERSKEDINFYQQVYFHKLGTPASDDTYIIGKEFTRIAETTLRATDDGRYLLASVANGDGGEFAHYLRDPAGKWTQITRFSDEVRMVSFGLDGMLYLLSFKQAPRGKVLSMPVADPNLGLARTIVPERQVTIENVVPAPGRLYVAEMAGGPSAISIFSLDGRYQGSVPTPEVSSVVIGTRLIGDEILYGVQSYVEPFAWYRFNPADGSIKRTGLAGASSVNPGDVQVTRVFATSKDGTRVPLNIISRKGTVLNGRNPTILYGYGGYSVSLSPNYIRRNRLWLEAGGIYAEANLRGGSEYGEEWHNAGKLTRKQNVFDDFAACARYLIDQRYTSPKKLAIEGGSNGGLLMGAALTQHPELFRAVVSYAGWYDMLRLEVSPNGAFNVTELGSVKDAAQFRALFAYSPYHHVRDHTRYPAVLFITGDNDARVDPWHSRKMIARLQAATRSNLPVLLETSAAVGHGTGTSLEARIAQETDVIAFLFDQLGVRTEKAPSSRSLP